MADPPSVAQPYQSLYRRYRSRRFDELRGQEHVVRALRTAVQEGRVGHAYLFSGPRGTGKTSTARILAKVLNCAAPVDGEPCGVCENCRAVDEGRIVDWLLELDAASNNGVANIRELIDRIPLGTSGNRKVVILDEVHMLSTGAANALLKSLEEPPGHVVFVLATTDPQKVLPTIRSRTQHLEFHLLPAEVLADHVRWVIADAGLDLGDEAVDHVVRKGGGSARDTLSALDQVAAMGGVVDTSQPVDAVLDAMVRRDPGAALVAVSEAVGAGRDPRVMGEQVIGKLRDAFLAVMGAPDRRLPAADLDRAREVGAELGPAGLTRALDVIGEALTELGRKPDPRVVLEVALVRVCRPEADRSPDALLERIERLERALAEGGPVAVAGSGGGGPSAPAASSGGTARPAPGAAAERPVGPGPVRGVVKKSASPRKAAAKGSASPAASPAAGSPAAPATPATAAAPDTDPSSAEPAPDASPSPGAPALTRDALALAWGDTVLERLGRGTRAIYSTGRFVETDGDTVVFALANAPTRDHCEKKRGEVEAALSEHFGRPVRLRLVTEDQTGSTGATGARTGAAPVGSSATMAAAAPTSPAAHDGEDIHPGEVAELPDAPDAATGVERLAAAFPGAELIEEPREPGR